MLGTDKVTLNNNIALIDALTSSTGAIATVFVREGDAFHRVVTSLKKEDGQRAVGTALASTHPAYALMLKGQPYTGRATLFGREYMTHYTPLKDPAGEIIASPSSASTSPKAWWRSSNASEPWSSARRAMSLRWSRSGPPDSQ